MPAARAFASTDAPRRPATSANLPRPSPKSSGSTKRSTSSLPPITWNCSIGSRASEAMKLREATANAHRRYEAGGAIARTADARRPRCARTLRRGAIHRPRDRRCARRDRGARAAGGAARLPRQRRANRDGAERCRQCADARGAGGDQRARCRRRSAGDDREVRRRAAGDGGACRGAAERGRRTGGRRRARARSDGVRSQRARDDQRAARTAGTARAAIRRKSRRGYRASARGAPDDRGVREPRRDAGASAQRSGRCGARARPSRGSL